MKKIILIVIALSIIGEAGGAWLLGRSIERRTEEAITDLGAMSPYIRVVDSRFHRGWFVSEQDAIVEAFGDAKSGVPVPGAPPNSAPLRVTIHNVIHHGPICGFTCIGVAQVYTHLKFAEPLQEYLHAVFGDAEPLSLRSRLDFFGGGSGNLASPAIPDALLEDGSHVSSQGFSFDTAYGSNFDSYSVRGSLPHLIFKSADNKRLELSEMGVVVRSTRALRSLYAGDSSIEVGTLAIGGISPTGAVTLKNLRAASNSSLADGYLSMVTKLGVESVSTAPLTLTGAHFDFTFRHLQAEALEQISAASRAQNQNATESPMARLGAMTKALQTPAIVLFSHQPEIGVDRISLATAAGGASLTGTIKTHDIDAQDFQESASSMALLQKIDADLELTADDAFLTSLPGGANTLGQLQMFVGQGLLSHEANKFHALIGYHRGQVTFNGKPYGSAGLPAPAVK